MRVASVGCDAHHQPGLRLPDTPRIQLAPRGIVHAPSASANSTHSNRLAHEIDMTRSISHIAVFCGSNFGKGDCYRAGAAALGQAMAQRGIALVYGGTNKGLMGVLADAVLAGGGHAHGIITERLHAKGHLHPGLKDFEILPGMGARKARMAALADAFIALPGGIGTLEEFMEVWTLNQLGEIDKPAGLLDIAGFYRPFMGFVDHMIAESFLPAAHRGSIVVTTDAEALIDGLARQEAVSVPKWMSPPAAS
jgi:uncharacterized protein (TIGR00730 family)